MSSVEPPLSTREAALQLAVIRQQRSHNTTQHSRLAEISKILREREEIETRDQRQAEFLKMKKRWSEMEASKKELCDRREHNASRKAQRLTLMWSATTNLY